LSTALPVTFIRTVATDLMSITLNCSAVDRIQKNVYIICEKIKRETLILYLLERLFEIILKLSFISRINSVRISLFFCVGLWLDLFKLPMYECMRKQGAP